MKTKIILSITLFFLISFFASSQVGYTISTEKRLINGVDSTVFVLEIDRALDHDVKKAWDKMIKRNGKVKPVTKNDLTTVSGVVISAVDEDPIDIYTSAIQMDSSVKVYAVFIVDSTRVDPNGSEGKSVKVRKVLSKFGGKVYKQVLERELEENQSKLESLVKSRDKNLKLQDSKMKSIQGDSLKIASAETEIELQKGQLQGATDRYVTQKNKVAGLKHAEKEQLKQEKSTLKELDKERKSIEKDIEKETNKILDLKAKIRDYWYQVQQLKEDLAKIELEITEQRTIVQEAQNAFEAN